MKNVHTSRKIIFSALVFLAAVVSVQAASFADVSPDHPNAAAIDYLTKEEVINGYPDGTFRPEDPVNRAEALKILLLASGVEIQNPSADVFPDVPAGAWFAPFVFSAKSAGIVDGYLDGTFRPDQTVNLVEALKILLNTNAVPLGNYETSRQLFTDSEKNAWYNPFLFYAKTFGLVDPDLDNQVFPAKPLTRSQLAEIVYRFRTRIETVCPRMLENIHAIPTGYFRGIVLDRELPRVFYENEIFAVGGSLTEPVESVSAVLESRDDKNQEHFLSNSDNASFEIAVSVGAPGSYNFSLIPSTVNSNTAAVVEVLPRECAPAVVSTTGLPPGGIQSLVAENEPTITWTDSANNIFRIVIRQGENRVEKLVSGGQSSISLDPAEFVNFSAGSATLQVFGAKSENGFSYEPRTNWFGSSILTLNLGQHYFSKLEESKIEIANLPVYRTGDVSLSATAKVDLENEAYLINPRGKVETVSIFDNTAEISAGTPFVLNLQLSEIGTYILEINSTDGIAALNHPIYLPSEFPLLPDFDDLREPIDNSNISMNRERAIWLKLINDFRAQNQLSRVALDEELSVFAQSYADTMASQNFFGHIDPAGRDPDARRIAFGLPLPVGENLARDSATEYAHEGLLRSAAHRQNIVEPEWTRVGLGIAKDSEDNLIFVQEFSADPLTPENLTGFRTQLLDLINERRASLGAEFEVDGQLESVAQGWSEKMAIENFTGFVSADNSLENSVRATGYTGGFSSFIVSAGRLAQIVEGLNEEIFIDNEKTRIAIGLVQNSAGRIIATLIFR